MTGTQIARHHVAPTAQQCHDLAAFWRKESTNPKANGHSRAIASFEADHWEDMAARVERIGRVAARAMAELELATPIPTCAV